MNHGKATGSNVHTIVAFRYADAAARLAAVPSDFTPEDVDKVAKQLNNGSKWVLESISPVVWSPFASSGSSGVVLSNVRYADVGAAPASPDGSIAAPFTGLAAALADTPNLGIIYLVPGSYAGVHAVTKTVTLKGMDTIVEGSALSGDLAASNTAVGTLNVATGLSVICIDVGASVINLIDNTTSLSTQRCLVGSVTAGVTDGYIIGESTRYTGTVAASYLDATNCRFDANVSISEGGDCSFWGCDFQTITLTFTAAAGVVLMDALSNANWVASGSTLVNGVIRILGTGAVVPNVVAVALTNISLAVPDWTASSWDGVAVAVDSRVLLTQQTNPVENGTYVRPAAGALVRAVDSIFCGSRVYVENGEIYAGCSFVQEATGVITVGASSLLWACLDGPRKATPLTTLVASGAGAWITLATVPGPAADGYDIVLVVDNVATKSDGSIIARSRGPTTYRRASGVVTLSDDSLYLTAATFLQQVVSGTNILLQGWQQPAGSGDYTYRIRTWFEYVRAI